MKKLIVFSVIFALLAAAVFADVNVGGTVGGSIMFAKGDSEDTNDAHQPFGYSGIQGRIDLSGQNDDGTFGGYFRTFSDYPTGWGFNFAQVWWKPLDFVRLTVGNNWWGDFGSNAIVRWDFYADASDNGVVNENYWGAGAVFGGFEEPGVLLAITPIDGLAINFMLPYPWSDQNELRNVYTWFKGQVQYWIAGVGKIGLTYENSPSYGEGRFDGWIGTWAGDDPGTYGIGGGGWLPSPKVYLDFFLTALEDNGLQVSLGFGYKFPVTSEKYALADAGYGLPAIGDVTLNDNVNVALGVNFWSGDFALKMRVFAGFGGSLAIAPQGKDTVTINNPFELKLDILPSYNIDGIFRFFFSAGINMKGKDQSAIAKSAGGKFDVAEVDKSDTFGFHINPYIIKPISTGGTFYAGFRLAADNMINLGKDAQGNDAKVHMDWQIPLAFSFGF